MDSMIGITLAYAAGVALIIVSGLPPLLARAVTPATIAEAVAHLVRWAVLFATLAVLLPYCNKIFDDFGSRLPLLTELVLRASFAAAVWMPGLLLVGAAATLLFHRLYRDLATRPLAKRLSLLSTGTALVVVLGVGVAVCLPLIQLLNDLS